MAFRFDPIVADLSVGGVPVRPACIASRGERLVVGTDDARLIELDTHGVQMAVTLPYPVVSMGQVELEGYAQEPVFAVVDRTGGVLRLDHQQSYWCPEKTSARFCRNAALAKDGLCALVLGMDGLAQYRHDHLQVIDPIRREIRWDVSIETRDCFAIDHIGISPDGRNVAATGLDTVYTSDGDWAFGQLQRLVVVDVESGTATLDGVIGETSRPSEHSPIPLAISNESVFVGEVAMPLHGPTDAFSWLSEFEELESDPGSVLAIACLSDERRVVASSAEYRLYEGNRLLQSAVGPPPRQLVQGYSRRRLLRDDQETLYVLDHADALYMVTL